MKKRKYFFCIIFIVVINFNYIVRANNTDELEEKKSQVQNKINETSSEISDVRSDLTDALKEVSKLTEQISEYESEIIEAQIKLDDLDLEIEKKQKNIEEQEKIYAERKIALDKRLVAVYESGNTTYLDVLLSSSSLTDFISKYYLVEKIAESDRELLTKIQNIKIQIDSEKNELENTKKEVESTKSSIEQKKLLAQGLVSEKQNLVNNLSNEEKELQAELDEFEKENKEIEQRLAQIATENKRKEAQNEEKKIAQLKTSPTVTISNVESNDIGSNPISEVSESDPTSYNTSSFGFICPLAGRGKNDITTGFYGYYNHKGVDFARNSKGAVDGLPVLAAKSGVVDTSKAFKNSSGQYASYGEYIIIDHQDGTATVYAHMQPGSRKVQKGDKVSQGQQIGNVGQTGNATGPHLHFEVRIAGKRVDPTNYLP